MNETARDEYFEYLQYVQQGPEPSQTYIDWSGETVLSFEDWLKQYENKSQQNKIETPNGD